MSAFGKRGAMTPGAKPAFGVARPMQGDAAPGPLTGLIEVRGVGVTAAARTLAFGPIDLVLDLASEPPDKAIERMPEPETVEIGGLGISRLILSAGDPNAVLRLSAALAASQHGV